MLYVLEIPNCCSWKIEDGDSSHRWRLYYRNGDGEWKNVASYTTPGAAALAVAGGDTGIVSWDRLPHATSDFHLSQWKRTWFEGTAGR